VTFSIEPPLPGLRPEWDISEMDAGAVASQFDLSIELEDRGDVIHLRAIYSLDLFEPTPSPGSWPTGDGCSAGVLPIRGQGCTH
jgi:hypothetical protein